jgi:hypothetical protein
LKERSDQFVILTFGHLFAEAFGVTMTWSPDSKKLAYLAERKVPKPKPFFTSYGKKDEGETEDDKKKKDDESTRVSLK